MKSLWYHEDAATSMKEFIDLLEEKFNEHFQKLKNEYSDISKKSDLAFEPELFERVNAEDYLFPEDEPLEADDLISEIDE